MFLIVGLGNPGTKYDNTHHNIGFEVIDCLAQRWGVSFLEKHKGLLGSSDRAQGRVFLLKPQTFMNLSGESVVPVAQFYKIPLDHTLVLYDDLDLPAGTIRIRKTGGSGGHNGMKSLIQLLGSEDFPRVRIGIGRPADPVDRDQAPAQRS